MVSCKLMDGPWSSNLYLPTVQDMPPLLQIELGRPRADFIPLPLSAWVGY